MQVVDLTRSPSNQGLWQQCPFVDISMQCMRGE